MLLNPRLESYSQFDPATVSIFKKTIEFFEKKGKRQLKKEDHESWWYTDFLDFIKKERVFYTFLTPSEYGEKDCRWDSSRNSAYSELLGFYSLSHWYAWQVSILGLGPIWIGKNEEVKKKTARLLKEGGLFAFGLSEKEHGADLIGTDMELIPVSEGKYIARGDKYYIGNGNCAALVSVFAKQKREYVFFVVETSHPAYKCTQNVVNSQKYVAEFVLNDYPIEEKEILSRGRDAWDTSLATVAFAKFNLGMAAIGICTHSFYEALNHAGARKLYGMFVTDFPHVRQLFLEAFSRLTAMRLFAYRAKDYMRIASQEDRRYLLFNPMVKMKVTMQGEEVINLLWDVIAARGFEKDMYFESATRDIRMLPKLEGTAHVNMVLVIKFMESFLFDSTEVPEVPHSDSPAEELFLFRQGATTKGQDRVHFGAWKKNYGGSKIKNTRLLEKQIDLFCDFLKNSGPSPEQQKDIDFMLTIGELFTVAAYGSLILEQAAHEKTDPDTLEEIFDFMVRDFGRHALTLYQKKSSSENQQKLLLQMIKRPDFDEERSLRVFTKLFALKEAYRMNE